MLDLHKHNAHLNLPTMWDWENVQERQLRLSYPSLPATHRVNNPDKEALSESRQSGLHLYLPYYLFS